MPSETAFRRGTGFGVVIALSFLSGAKLLGQTPDVNEQKASKPETFTASTANIATDGGEKLRIQVFRWSTDEDRGKLIAAFKEKGTEQLDTTLQALPESGYIWTDESLGYSVHYAYREPLKNGGELVILATDRPLGSWSGHPWTAKSGGNPITYPYSVIELVLNSSGRGQGRMSLSSKIVANETQKTIMLEENESSAAVLISVQRTNDHSRN
jgi:hypothetical protein